MLRDFSPGQLVLIVEQVTKLRARDRGKAARGLVIGLALELDRANEIGADAGRKPTLDEREKPRRVAHHIRKQPVDRAHRMRFEGKGAFAEVFDAW